MKNTRSYFFSTSLRYMIRLLIFMLAGPVFACGNDYSAGNAQVPRHLDSPERARGGNMSDNLQNYFMRHSLNYGPGYGTYGSTGGYGNGFGRFGQSGLYGGMYYDLWGRDGPTRGGRRKDGGYDLFDMDNPQNYFMRHGLNYGPGFLNSAGNNSRTFTLAGGGGVVNTYVVVESFTNGGAFAGCSSTASVTVKVTRADGTTPVADGTTVTWSVTRAQNNSPAMYAGWGSKKTGLTWGATAAMVKWDDIPELTASTTSTTSGGLATIQLTDIVGERNITISATVTVDSTPHTATQTVTYGNGPLAVFTAPDVTNHTWTAANQLCNGGTPSGGDDPSTWNVGDNGTYKGGGKLPTRAEYQNVAPVDTRYGSSNPNGNAKGAAYAAGWPDYLYWTGEASNTGVALSMNLCNGSSLDDSVVYGYRVACLR